MPGAFSAAAFDEYAFDVDFTSSSALFLSIDGVQRATDRLDPTGKVLHGSLTVVDILNETPNTCTFRAKGFQPMVGQRVLISLGGITNPARLFAGTVLSVQQVYVGTPANQEWGVSCVDDTWKLAQVKVTTRFVGESATDIAIDLLATYAPDFDTSGIEAGLPVVDEITFTNEDLATCLTRLAKRIGGYWKPGEFEDVKLFITNADDDPAPLTDVNPPLGSPDETLFSVNRDISQMVTRVLGEGNGSKVLADVAVGETLIPVESVEFFDAVAGGTFVSGPQRCDYDGVHVGGTGSLVGPGFNPGVAPVLALAAGVGVTTGLHDVTQVFVTASGRTLPGPVASLTVGVLPPPSATPVAASPSAGGSVTAGNHYCAMTFETAAGETTPSAVTATVTAVAGISAPPAAPDGWGQNIGAGGADSDTGFSLGTYYYGYTFVNDANPLRETTISPVMSSPLVVGSAPTNRLVSFTVYIPGWTPSEWFVSQAPSGWSRRWYRTVADGSVYKRLPVGGVLVASPGSGGGPIIQGQEWVNTAGAIALYDGASDASLGADAPASDRSGLQTIALSNLQLPTSAIVTDRNIYMTAAGGSQLKFVAGIGLSGTTYSITMADGSLGANVPASNTATANQIAVSGITVGPAGTTARELYMSATGGGGARKRALVIANNSATTGTIAMDDVTLATELAEPTSDTSGLTQPDGQVLPGSTTMPVAGPGSLPTAGWAVIGNGAQVIRYTGQSSTTLTGIPSTGPGSITAAVSYNSTITAAPQLTGVPASGVGSVLFALVKGDPINLFVVVDDLVAQATLAAALGGTATGIVEEYIQDRRLTKTEITARAQAVLALRGHIDTSIAYAVRGDRNTRSGTTIDIDLTEFGIDDAFKIQKVTISNFQPALDPVYDVEASTSRFAFEDLLRIARGGAV